MGNFLFLALHLFAVLFFAWALLLTIPLHLIYSAVRSRGGARPTPRTHVVCPWCQEYAHKEAAICPHCRKELVPESEQRARKPWAQF